MRSLPKITIVTPSLNQGQFVEMTVRSVLLQRYPRLQYIFMDGGSSDDTLDVLAPYRPLFHHFVSEPDGGQADAVARGFAASDGEIMAYLNSDDVLAPDSLSFVAKFFHDHPSVDVLYSHRCTIKENNRSWSYWILPPHCSYLMRRWDMIPQETCFWRRRIYDDVGGVDPSYDFALDYDLFVRFMDRGRIRRVNRFLGAFRSHEASKTSRWMESTGVREVQRVCGKYGIRSGRFHHYLYQILREYVDKSGEAFARSRRCLPGALPGLGYDYDDVWGGMLKEKRIPPRSATDATGDPAESEPAPADGI